MLPTYHPFKTSFLPAILLAVLLMMPGLRSQAQVTGLDDWTLYIDQGHSQTENMGLFSYSEAEKVLRVGLALRDMFLEQTDIEAVYVARQTDQDYITLAGRVDEANTLGVDFYYSIHSDAGPPHVNRTLMLWGGWKSNGELVEKTPEGGRAYGAILDFDLSGAMRIGRTGNIPDRVFYQGDVYHHENQWPFLYVNRVTDMASLLSEAGFHTNPGQQMLNLNAEWKILEALSAFRSFLEWHEIDRLPIGIATGIIRDVETGLAINGATVTIGDKTYTTDCFESLFNQYSNDPDQLRNGFYWIEDLEPLSTLEVVFSREGYESITTELLIESDPNGLTEDNLSFLDPEMTSLIPPTVVKVEPADELDWLIPGTDLVIHFSRKMDRESVEEAFGIDPVAPVSFTWNNDFILRVNTSQLEYLEHYTITLDGGIAKNALTGQFLDGDGDGEEGGNYVFEVSTSDEDTDPPYLLDYSPSEHSPSRETRPVIRLVYDEEIIEESIGEDALTLTAAGEDAPVEGVMHHLVVNEQSILHFFPTEDLQPGITYVVHISQGLSDMFGNETEAQSFMFYLLDQPITQTTVIDDFNTGISGWWHPNQAGQTTGIITELTSRTAEGEVINHSVGSTGSMKFNYGWDTGHGAPYVRLYLPPTAPQNNNRFNIDDVLQVYVFGDGSHNEFRMVIRDGANQLEGQEWITIDWVGWKLVSWDLANDPVYGIFGVGNGVLDGANFYIDGFHFQYADGANPTGAFYFDHLHFVRREEVNYPVSLYENFQDYEDFTTDIFPWITIDVDGDVTWNPAGFTFPGSGTPYAFKVLNPAETTPPIIDNHPPVDGDKYLIAMMSQALNEDKWLISPQIRATDLSQLSFYAKSIEVATYGPERIRVLVSGDDGDSFEFDPDDFVMISGGDYIEVPDDWTQYAFYLGDYDGEVIRFAIQYVSHDDYMLMLDAIEVVQAETYTLSLLAQPEEGGQVSGEGAYAQNQSVTVEASPHDGYAFTHWTDDDGNELSTEATYTFPMPGQDLTLTAHFALIDYYLTLNVSPEEGGTVTGEGYYNYGDPVSAVAVPAEDHYFLHWTDRDGNVMSEEETYVFDMPAQNLELTANFEYAVGLPEHGPEHLLVYPNPAKQTLHVDSEHMMEYVRITDLAGRQLLWQQVNSRQVLLDVDNLKPGFYLLQAHTRQGIMHVKIQIIQ